MLNKLKVIDLKKAGIASAALTLLTILVHLLVIFQILPHTWINGGRVASFDIARQTSINGIWFLLFDILVSLIAGGIIPLKLKKGFAVVLAVYLWIQVPYTLFGFIIQLLGTVFEKLFMSVIVFVLFVSKLRLALEKRW